MSHFTSAHRSAVCAARGLSCGGGGLSGPNPQTPSAPAGALRPYAWIDSARSARARSCVIAAADSGGWNRNPCPSGKLHVPQPVALPAFLDPFGDHVEAQALTEVDDPAHELLLARILVDPVDERTVDLENVDREVAQMRERRVAGAEVVDRDPDPQRPEAVELAHDLEAVPEQQALRDLEREQVPAAGLGAPRARLDTASTKSGSCSCLVETLTLSRRPRPPGMRPATRAPAGRRSRGSTARAERSGPSPRRDR